MMTQTTTTKNHRKPGRKLARNVDREIVRNCRQAQAERAAELLDAFMEGADAEVIDELRAQLREIESQLADALAGR